VPSSAMHGLVSRYNSQEKAMDAIHTEAHRRSKAGKPTVVKKLSI